MTESNDAADDYSRQHHRFLRTTSIPSKRRKISSAATEEGGEQDDGGDGDGSSIIWFSPTMDSADDAFATTTTTTKSSSFARSCLTHLLEPRYCPRPLPSSQMLAATTAAATSKKTIPLIEEFLKSLGKTPLEKGENPSCEGDVVDANNEITAKPVNKIDDPKFSTLSAGQHRRFRQLTQAQQTLHQLPKSRSAENAAKREYKTLRRLVEAEQRMYLDCLDWFWESEEKQRLTLGFRSESGSTAAFTRVAACPDFVQNAWKKFTPNAYDKACHQTISLPFHGCSSVDLNQRQQRRRQQQPSLLTIDAISSEVIRNFERQQSRPAAVMTLVKKLPPEGSPIPRPNPSSKDGRLVDNRAQFLRDDSVAKTLALKYKADVITTSETLEVLLQDIEHADWILPAYCPEGTNAGSRNAVVLDLPFPQPYASPRDCLSRGFQEGILQWILKNNNNNEPVVSEHAYTLLTLPVLNDKVCRVLVRSAVGLCDDQQQPMSFRTHLEYFPERGLEIPSSYEKALWVLDHLLKPGGRVVLARVDPSSCCLRSWQDVSVAHAIVEDNLGLEVKDRHTSKDPLNYHWHNVIRILQAARTIGRGHHILCLPARGESTNPVLQVPAAAAAVKKTGTAQSISVHPHQQHVDASGEENFLKEELSRAGQVPLGPAALKRCLCHWGPLQANEKVPFTFPISSGAVDRQRQPAKS